MYINKLTKMICLKVGRVHKMSPAKPQSFFCKNSSECLQQVRYWFGTEAAYFVSSTF